MEHMLMNRNSLAALVTNIGCQLGDDTFMIQEEALECLQAVWTLLSDEDPLTLPVRRHLGALSFGPKVLVPLLQYVYDDSNDDVEDRDAIFLMACKFLVALTEPLSVLLAGTPGVGPDVLGPCSALEKDMARVLQDITTEFLRPEVHQALFTPLLERLRKTDEGPLTTDEVSVVNCMLYIYRNILTARKCPSENLLIVGLMFQGGLQECCHLMFSRPEMDVWVVAFVQLLPIIYCNECDLLLEEGESCQGDGDGGVGETKTLMDALSDHIQPQSSSMSLSSSSQASSSDDQDSSTMVEDTKSEQGASLGDRVSEAGGGANMMVGPELFNQSFENMDDSMVDNLMILLTRKNLRVLAEDFIEHAFSDLLCVLKGHLLCGNSSNLSATYVGWVIHYFLSLSRTSKVPVKKLKEVVSYDMVGFLVYEICTLQESLLTGQSQQTVTSQTELEMCVKGLGSILDYLCTVPTDKQTEEDAEYIRLVKLYMVDMMNLSEMLIFLLNQCSLGPGNTLLIELILLNHKFLLMAQSLEGCGLDMTHHIKNFVCPELVVKLFSVLDGDLLSSAGRGGEVVSAVFTMAYHVVADHGRVDCMVQPTILSTLLTLDDDRLLDMLSAEHIDLVNHVMKQLFNEVDDELLEQMKAFDSSVDSGSEIETSMETGNNRTLTEGDFISSESDSKNSQCDSKNGEQKHSRVDWNDEEISVVMDTYTKHSSEGVKNFLEKLHTEKSLHKSSFQILYKLLIMDIIGEEEFKQALSDTQDPNVSAEVEAFISLQEQQEQQELQEPLELKEQDGDMEELNSVIKEIHEKCPHGDIQWLQQQLMEACFVLCGGRELGKPYAEEPLYLYSSLSRQCLPLPVLTSQQKETISRPPVRRLLQLVGCEMDKGYFPRLPAHVNARDLHTLCRRLGPMHDVIEKVVEADLVEEKHSKLPVSSEKLTPEQKTSQGRPVNGDMSNNMWPQIVFLFNNSLKVN